MAKSKSYFITQEQINQLRMDNPRLKLPSAGTYDLIANRNYRNRETGEIFTRRVIENAVFGQSQEERYSLIKYINKHYYSNAKSTWFYYLLKKGSIVDGVKQAFKLRKNTTRFALILEVQLSGKTEYRSLPTLLKRDIFLPNAQEIINELVNEKSSKYGVSIDNVQIAVIQ